jgi:predicted dehydrogenase
MSVRVGFVGAGGIARAHMDNLRELADVAVVAVSDVRLERARQAAGPWSAAAYSDCVQMLDREHLDAVYVCVPPAEHGSIEIELAELGIPFYVEKPIHLDLMVAAQVEAIAAEKGLVTCSGYQLRYSDAVQAAREELSDRQITLAQGFYIVGMPAAAWWRRRALSGGQVVEQSTHVYDLLRYLAGEVETVSAFASTGAMTDVEGFDVEDASVAALDFSGGAVGHVVSSCVLKEGGEPQVALRFDGRGYTLKLTAESIELAAAEERRSESFPPPPGGWMARADRAFIEAVRRGDPSGIRSDYTDSLRTLALTLAVNRSFETAERVSPAEVLLAASHGCCADAGQ